VGEPLHIRCYQPTACVCGVHLLSQLNGREGCIASAYVKHARNWRDLVAVSPASSPKSQRRPAAPHSPLSSRTSGGPRSSTGGFARSESSPHASPRGGYVQISIEATEANTWVFGVRALPFQQRNRSSASCCTNPTTVDREGEMGGTKVQLAACTVVRHSFRYVFSIRTLGLKASSGLLRQQLEGCICRWPQLGGCNCGTSLHRWKTGF
jgi:hypothetical protein